MAKKGLNILTRCKHCGYVADTYNNNVKKDVRAWVCQIDKICNVCYNERKLRGV